MPVVEVHFHNIVFMFIMYKQSEAKIIMIAPDWIHRKLFKIS